MRILFLGIFLVISYSSGALACSSDFSCRIGESCVKAPFKSRGVCMKTVDEYGTRTYNLPSLESVGPRMSNDGCSFSTDCPIGFKCDRRLKVCLKR